MEEILIKNMVCPRCIMAVEDSLQREKIGYEKVMLGKVFLPIQPTQDQFEKWETQLNKLGFEILKAKEHQKIETIKNQLHQLLQKDEISGEINMSEWITMHLTEDYSSLSHLFSTLEGVTIEKYFINLKIEKVKEWLFYQELNLSEMAWKLGYSSVQHLSSQFKKVTGMTPSEYKKLKEKPRKGMDEV
ncbi:AraC family transcriptional regulator [Echinicola jeungdonensis]|uniref:Helix-turn-helix domain-containing protein n=1 Tax=Echinicola jeungdonensis TaxID=709343 RepID=A0ABV5J5B3_9BACT|nr:AraC family transcriptional regulator [Echinicola jeungdonensis]MDN3668700.1 AraC family transcriptional regulator [Echinicola jeungdonensis]